MRDAGTESGLIADLLAVGGMNAPKSAKPHWLLDRHVLAGLFVAWPIWLGLGFFLGGHLKPPASAVVWLSLVCWQPLLEEVAFRGLLQGQLQQVWPRSYWGPVSLANALTTMVFAASHLLQQAPAWAMLVIPPSLIMGHMRERFNSIWPALALHAYYNLGFGLTAWLTQAH